MGARGKKRRRADGSIAGGKTPVVAAQSEEYLLEPVPTQALFEAVSEYLVTEAMSNAGLDALLEERYLGDAGTPTDRIADRFDIDVESLNGRADRLTMLITKQSGLHRMEDGKLAWIDPALLEHAASVELSWSRELRWPA